MCVSMRHQLVSFFTRSVQRYGVINRIILGEGQLGVGAVNRTGGGEYQVFDFMMPAALQQIAKTDQV